MNLVHLDLIRTIEPTSEMSTDHGLYGENQDWTTTVDIRGAARDDVQRVLNRPKRRAGNRPQAKACLSNRLW